MPDSLELPGDFVRRILGFDSARAWLDRLPALLAACTERWNLQLQAPFPLSYNYVCPAVRQDGTAVVLKIGPHFDELAIEVAALEAYRGRGTVRLLDSAPEISAFLLERLRPGTMLAELENDEQATEIAAGVMESLWIPAPDNPIYPTTATWARGLERLRQRYSGGTGPFPDQYVATAETLFSELLETEGEKVLLHGDLHHFNILRATRVPWLALDPKGLIGEREYEIGAFLRNPDNDRLDEAALKKRTLRRIDQFAERFGFDRGRLAAWGFAQALLSAWWSVEDGDPEVRSQLRLAEALQDQF